MILGLDPAWSGPFGWAVADSGGAIVRSGVEPGCLSTFPVELEQPSLVVYESTVFRGQAWRLGVGLGVWLGQVWHRATTDEPVYALGLTSGAWRREIWGEEYPRERESAKAAAVLKVRELWGLDIKADEAEACLIAHAGWRLWFASFPGVPAAAWLLHPGPEWTKRATRRSRSGSTKAPSVSKRKQGSSTAPARGSAPRKSRPRRTASRTLLRFMSAARIPWK